MTRFYLLRLLTLCWAIAGMATTDNHAANMLQELAFALMGSRLERTHVGEVAEDTFEFIDLLAA